MPEPTTATLDVRIRHLEDTVSTLIDSAQARMAALHELDKKVARLSTIIMLTGSAIGILGPAVAALLTALLLRGSP